MSEQGLLTKLKQSKELELVDPSEEVSQSFIEKSNNSMKAAKVLTRNKLCDDAISSAYYSTYNILTSLLAKTGIKCENHTASILVLKKLYHKNELAREIFKHKEERENAQYHLTLKNAKETAEKMIKKAEELNNKIRLEIQNLKAQDIEKIRKEFHTLT